MPTAHEVATELRKFADSLDTDPDVEIAKANVWWYFWSESDKEMFKRIVRLLPRPLVKSIDDPTSDTPRLVVTSASNAAVEFEARIPQRVTCRIIEPAHPAVYDCEPILSETEESEITA